MADEPTRWKPGGFNQKNYEQIRQQRNFVPAYAPGEPGELPARIGVLPPELDTLQPASQAQVALCTTYVDRARGFVRAVMPLSAVAGTLGLVAGVGLFGAPLLSAAALLWFFTWFGLVWLAAYLAHTFVSPDGSAWLHVFMLWRVIRAEQRHRHERYWTTYHGNGEE